MNNGYPLDLIFLTIRKRLFFRFNHPKPQKQSNQ